MTRSKRLEKIADLEKTHERLAGKELANNQLKLANQNTRLEQLIEYREDYTAKFRLLAANGLQPGQLKNFRTFLANLNRAIEQQRKSIERGSEALDLSHQQWLARHQRYKALHKAAEKYSTSEQLERDKQEQRESDDLLVNGEISVGWKG